MKTDLLFIYLVFYLLVGATLASASRRKSVFARSWRQWQLDGIGLTIHGTLVPLFQTWVVYRLLALLFPSAQGSWSIPPVLAFLLNFVVVDYLYYWNHRWLHSGNVWRFHSVHHSGESFDVFTTSRNSALTSFLILYVWVNGLFLFLLESTEGYVWGIALSNALDLLRHSRFSWWPSPRWSPIISPKEHAWHHSTETFGINFGGNLNLWDRWHGTYHMAPQLPERTGIPLAHEDIWPAFWKGRV